MDINWLLLPPIAFVLILGINVAMTFFSSKLALKSEAHPDGKMKSYACGEDVGNPRMQPDYREFFPFAFFFTIMHVVALIVATVPAGAGSAAGIALLYIAAALSALFILFRR